MKTAFSKFLFAALLMAAAPLWGQSALDGYIREGLENNIVLKQRTIGLEKAMLSLQIANSYFSPAVGLQGNYTSGKGGRNISFPVGDLLNPVYGTLNQLTGSDRFPQIENVNQNFFPYNFYDAKVHTTLPIINTDLIYSRKISQQQIVMQEFEVDIYKRELIKNIKVAYFNYLSANEAVKIYESALTRGEEGKRVNESLLANGKGLPAYVLRSQSEIENIRAQKADAERQVENAQLYFNFLLNRDRNTPLTIDSDIESEFARANLTSSDSLSTENREELKLIRESIELNTNLMRMNKLFWAPKLNGFLDLGMQAENLKVNPQARYYLWGLQLDIPVFAGMRNRNKIKMTQLDVKSSELGYSGNQQQINLSAQAARNNLFTAYQNYQSAQKQQEAAQSYQKLIDKGYREGVNTFIEAIDARNQMTQAQFQVTINRYRVLSAAAQYEREVAAYSLP
ncbi:MAG: TolC family protein, partial [Cyclobacteriaceae bacterium]|nr:TolC family protein [Cyclobacteriaceae bacterium]